MTLIEKLVSAGYPREEMYHHDSDLYVYNTPATTKVIDEWFRAQQLNKEWFVSEFRDNISGKRMYDIAFQYYEALEECR